MLRARIGNPRNSPKDVVLLHSKSSFGEGPHSKRSAIRAPLEKGLRRFYSLEEEIALLIERTRQKVPLSYGPSRT